MTTKKLASTTAGASSADTPTWPLGGTGPTFPISAIDAGAIHGSELRKALKRIKESGSDKKQFLKKELYELCSMGG